MKNLIINNIWGDKIFESLDLEIYFESLKKVKNADKLVLTNNISKQNLEKLNSIYDNVVYGEISYYHTFHLVYDIVKKYALDYDYVLYSDTRDVIFQKDPFEYMISKPNIDLFLACEGMKIEENDINMYWHQNLRSTKAFQTNNSEKLPVVNGGTFGGKSKDVFYHLLLAVSNSNRKSNGVIPDQAIYSDMAYFMGDLKFVEYCHPYTSTFCATGEAIKRDNVNVNFVNGQVCNENNEPYVLFHQWDRTEYAEQIRNNFKNGNLRFTI